MTPRLKRSNNEKYTQKVTNTSIFNYSCVDERKYIFVVLKINSVTAHVFPLKSISFFVIVDHLDFNTTSPGTNMNSLIIYHFNHDYR